MLPRWRSWRGSGCTEAQLWQRLERKGFDDDATREAVERCKREGFLDDRLYARLYVEGQRKAVGDARLVGELVRKGIDGDAAHEAVASLERDEGSRCAAAFERLPDKHPRSATRRRRGDWSGWDFRRRSIYRILREHAARFGPLGDHSSDMEERISSTP